MKLFNWQILLGLCLMLLSAMVYIIHYFIFRDVHHIFIYLIGDIAFVFIEVLMVTLIIHHLLSEREKRTKLKKLNMVIGAFFSEVGTSLLKSFSDSDLQIDQFRKDLSGITDWSGRKFSEMSKRLKHYDFKMKNQRDLLEELKGLLIGKRDFLLRLLENPNLLEHESFTDLLWAVFHLNEELTYRVIITELPDTDYEHLEGDIKRVYALLVSEWLSYMRHLKDDYPYLFSLAVRLNPFDPNASAEVK